jgi:hypothetical protein
MDSKNLLKFSYFLFHGAPALRAVGVLRAR